MRSELARSIRGPHHGQHSGSLAGPSRCADVPACDRHAAGSGSRCGVTIRVYRYELIPRVRLNARAGEGARRGALLNADGGYADIHPWPELGDASLDEQLALLSTGETTALTAQSLRAGAADAPPRRGGRGFLGWA